MNSLRKGLQNAVNIFWKKYKPTINKVTIKAVQKYAKFFEKVDEIGFKNVKFPAKHQI